MAGYCSVREDGNLLTASPNKLHHTFKRQSFLPVSDDSWQFVLLTQLPGQTGVIQNLAEGDGGITSAHRLE